MCALATQTPKRKASFVKRAAKGEIPANHQVMLGEHDFLRLLVMERKRSERSERPFLLVLLDGCNVFHKDGPAGVREKFSKALLRSIRETDYLGWYEDGVVMGAIFTELSEPIDEAVQTIVAKITSAIHSHIPGGEGKYIGVSVHLFPNPAGDDHNDSGIMAIYPDLKSGAENKKAVRAIKRIVDVAGSLFALFLLLPVMVAIALAVKLSSKGPVLFKQNRIGQYSRPFTFMKFRSMYVNSDSKIHKEYIDKFISGNSQPAEKGGNGKVFKITNDPRVTPVGRFLRKSSLDELPQLFNVLIGDMSLVGPRPPLPYEVEKYDCWHRRRILEARPGITGLWQVNGRSRTSFDDMVRMDLRYIQQYSLLLDVKIMLQTPMAVFSGDGAY